MGVGKKGRGEWMGEVCVVRERRIAPFPDSIFRLVYIAHALRRGVFYCPPGACGIISASKFLRCCDLERTSLIISVLVVRE